MFCPSELGAVWSPGSSGRPGGKTPETQGNSTCLAVGSCSYQLLREGLVGKWFTMTLGRPELSGMNLWAQAFVLSLAFPRTAT